MAIVVVVITPSRKEYPEAGISPGGTASRPLEIHIFLRKEITHDVLRLPYKKAARTLLVLMALLLTLRLVTAMVLLHAPPLSFSGMHALESYGNMHAATTFGSMHATTAFMNSRGVTTMHSSH
jgi:hypothetical protein